MFRQRDVLAFGRCPFTLTFRVNATKSYFQIGMAFGHTSSKGILYRGGRKGKSHVMNEVKNHVRAALQLPRKYKLDPNFSDSTLTLNPRVQGKRRCARWPSAQGLRPRTPLHLN